jgi:DMSO reductase anchor subunit
MLVSVPVLVITAIAVGLVWLYGHFVPNPSAELGALIFLVTYVIGIIVVYSRPHD